MEAWTIDPGACVRCAACAVVAPALFEVTRKGTHVARQPESDAERAAARAAAEICPMQAIRAGSTTRAAEEP